VAIDALAAHGVLVAFLVLQAGFVEQGDAFGVLEMDEKLEYSFVERNTLTLTFDDLSTIALTNADDSIVHGRTVSVRPSRNNRVIDASYVSEKRPASL
jgi:hypothetical protein